MKVKISNRSIYHKCLSIKLADLCDNSHLYFMYASVHLFISLFIYGNEFAPFTDIDCLNSVFVFRFIRII